MHKKINKNFILILFILVIIIVGCRPPTTEGEKKSDYRSGTQGLVMNFLSGAPPKKLYVDEPWDNTEIPISIEVRNKGSYPTPDDDDDKWKEKIDVIFVSGFDKNIIKSWELSGKKIGENKYPFVNLKGKLDVLEGKHSNNPEGGYDILEFTGIIDIENLDIEKYNPNFLVTACYKYKTKASPSVCIDPRPFTTVKERKVCNIHDVSLKNQGAPIAITKVEEKAFSNSIQFNIRFKNIGKGDVIAINKLDKCSAVLDQKKSLEKKDMDYIKIVKVLLGKDKELSCSQLVSVGDSEKSYVRLVNNEGFVVCNLEKYKDGVEAAYTTPLYIEIEYGYRNTISKEVEVVKVPEPK